MTNLIPDWLEPIIELKDFDGDPEKYMDHIFSIFHRDFITSSPVFNNKKVLHDKRDDNGRPATFVHITTEENKSTGEREVCLRRCERISWIKAIIEHPDDPLVLVWEKTQSTNKRMAKRTYLFLEKFDFLVVMQEIKHGFYIITAIYVDDPIQKKRHIKAYNKYKGI